METAKYKIDYYNKVFDLNNSIETDNLSEAIDTARSISKLFEIENVRLYEMTEIYFK